MAHSGCQMVLIYRKINTEMGTDVCGYVYVYYGCVCAFTSLYTQTHRHSLPNLVHSEIFSIKTPVALGIPGKKTPFSTERKRASLEKCVIPVLG